MVCETESIPAFVANVCENEFMKTTKKKKLKWIVIFVY